MPKYKNVSRTNNTVHLYVGDKMHIKEMVKEFKKDDPRFSTESSAIRYYVHLGISTQRTTEDLKGNLDNAIIKKAIETAVRAELKFHSEHIEKLQNIVESFEQTTGGNFADLVKRTTIIEDKLDRGFESVINALKNILTTGENALRNLIVLRSILYVFLLGHKTGRIEPGKENIIKWQRIIKRAHEHANKLSVIEVKNLTNEMVEAQVIERISADIFREVLSLPEAKIS
ncbi:MAG TPA: hypothetical protein VK308_02420 [Pyrinomonadaceae bacterium]|nr:hypothetical protein [Pyrinomonadaceae bacterium]